MFASQKLICGARAKPGILLCELITFVQVGNVVIIPFLPQWLHITADIWVEKSPEKVLVHYPKIYYFPRNEWDDDSDMHTTASNNATTGQTQHFFCTKKGRPRRQVNVRNKWYKYIYYIPRKKIITFPLPSFLLSLLAMNLFLLRIMALIILCTRNVSILILLRRELTYLGRKAISVAKASCLYCILYANYLQSCSFINNGNGTSNSNNKIHPSPFYTELSIHFNFNRETKPSQAKPDKTKTKTLDCILQFRTVHHSPRQFTHCY